MLNNFRQKRSSVSRGVYDFHFFAELKVIVRQHRYVCVKVFNIDGVD